MFAFVVYCPYFLYSLVYIIQRCQISEFILNSEFFHSQFPQFYLFLARFGSICPNLRTFQKVALIGTSDYFTTIKIYSPGPKKYTRTGRELPRSRPDPFS